MDPNATLAQIRLATNELNLLLAEDDDDRDDFLIAQHASDLVDLVNGLDEWLTKGGYLPAEWIRQR